MTEILVEFVVVVVFIQFRFLFKVEMLSFRAKNSMFTVEQCTIKVAEDRFRGIVEKRGLSFGNHEKGHFPAL